MSTTLQADPRTDALVALGHTRFEGEVYLALQEVGTSTAYGVARQAGLNKANTYKALEALSRKGSVELVDDEERQWRAVPTDELLAQFERRSRTSVLRARRVLRPGRGTVPDSRVFRLGTVDAVYERARSMLASATSVVAVDAFPVPLHELRPGILDAIDRECEVCIRTYEPTRVGSAKVYQATQAIPAQWPGHLLTLAVDGRACLVAFITVDGLGLRDAFVTENPLMSMVMQNGVVGEALFGHLSSRIDSGDDAQAVARGLAEDSRVLEPADLPGRALLRSMRSVK